MGNYRKGIEENKTFLHPQSVILTPPSSHHLHLLPVGRSGGAFYLISSALIPNALISE